MERNKFIADFANLFDDTDSDEIKFDTKFHELDEWSSLISMSLIALAKTEYGKPLSGKEIRECVIVEDLFNLIASK